MSECEVARAQLSHDETEYNHGKKLSEQQTIFGFATCVATDDPRLKEK